MFEIVNGACVRDTTDSVYPDGTVLFNLKDDIGGTTNLAEARPDIVKALAELYEQWHRDMVRDKESRPKAARGPNRNRQRGGPYSLYHSGVPNQSCISVSKGATTASGSGKTPWS